MFSYISNKNSQTTFENDLIEEIQSIANQIFQPHSVSITRIQHQQMSLQLSPPTSEQADSEIKQTPQQQSSFHYFTNFTQNQRPFHHPFIQHQNQLQQKKELHSMIKSIKESQLTNKQQKQNQFQEKHQQKFGRLSKSMISSNHLKDPGSFSKNYLQLKDNAASQKIQKKNEITSQKKQPNTIQKQVLISNNMNKSNILKGMIEQSRGSLNKNTHKKGKFSQSYSSNYVSPYSTKGMKQNPKSYMSKSISQTKKSKQTLHIQFIKQKINENIEPQISHKVQKSHKYKAQNSKLSQIKSKYKQNRPLMHQYQLYADQHIYKTIKQEMSIWQTKNKQYQIFTPQQIENNWKLFIQNQKKFIQNKKQWIASKKLKKFQQQKIHYSPSLARQPYDTDRNSAFQSNPYKMTPQDFVKKYKRQKQKLKQKLQTYEITNFIEKTYQDSVKHNNQYFDSGQCKIIDKDEQNSDKDEVIQMISPMSQNENNQIQKLLIQKDNKKSKNGQQNFFISVGSETQRANFQKKAIQKKTKNHKDIKLSQSSIYENETKYKQKITSRDSKSQRRTTEKSNKRKDVNCLTPFKAKATYFSKQQQYHSKGLFDSLKHNSPLLTLQQSNKKSKQRENKSDNKQIHQLLNPKYFKSINEMQQYSSESRLKKDSAKKTFQKNQNASQQHLSIKNDNNIASRQKAKLNLKVKNKVDKFDQNLMNQIVKDLNEMRSQIQENKKNRKYKIQNYRNFTNVRQGKNQLTPKQTTGFFNLQGENYKNSDDFEPNQKDIQQKHIKNQRFNNHFNSQVLKKTKNKPEQIKNKSRSISPIQQENTTFQKNKRQSFSEIFNDDEKSLIKSSNFSVLSRQVENEKLILVRSRKEVQFILEDQQQSQKSNKIY